MASPQQKALVIASASSKPCETPISRVLQTSALKSTPVFRNGGSPLSDEGIWNRLREAGFDEESIKRRDKAALISYIAKIESEIYECQHHMGLLLLERKELALKYEEIKISTDSAEVAHRRDQVANLSALAEARKQEESLRRALAIEKECLANIEKTLHEMRTESAETKVASESRLAQARVMEENAQIKYIEAEAKLHSAEALQAEASRCHSVAERKLKEVEAREDELRRRLVSLKSEYDAKEKEISIERQLLCERQKTLQQGQEKLLEGQTLLNQREDYVFRRSQELSQLDKELVTAKEKIEKDFMALKEEKSNLDLKALEIATREEDVIKRESLQAKKEKEFLILQEKLVSKEHEEIQRLKAEHEAALEMRKIEFRTELEHERKLMEDEIDIKRQACEVREVNINQMMEQLQKRKHDFDLQLRALVDRENNVVQRLKSLEEREQILNGAEKAAEIEEMRLQKEREEVDIIKLEIQKCKESLEDKKKQIIQEQEKLEVTELERRELLSLQTKLKEEIDSFRAQKLEVMAEADELKAQKEKFETEWQLIDEKREEIRKETELIAEERKALCKFLKEEQDNLKLEKDALRDKLKHDMDVLSCEREAVMSKMQFEHAEWLDKIERERADFMRDIEVQKRELENSVNKRREEIENSYREREEEFEQEKAKELQYISSQKEMIAKDLEHVASEMKRLDDERIQISLDRERREKEWSEIKISVKELQIQTQKLQKQRESLHKDREEINFNIEHLKRLEDLKTASENMALAKMQSAEVNCNKSKVSSKKYLNAQPLIEGEEQDSRRSEGTAVASLDHGCLLVPASDSSSPLPTTPLSWIKKCAELIFKHSPEKSVDGSCQKEDASKISSNYGKKSIPESERSKEKNVNEKTSSRKQPAISTVEEANLILEVPLVGGNGESAENLNLDSSTSRKEVVHCKEATVQNRAGEKARSTNNSANMLLAGSKRQKSSLSGDHVDAQNKNHKKRRQHKDVTGTMTGETTSKCEGTNQMLSPEDENSLMSSFNQTLVYREEADKFIDKNHQVPEATAENSAEQTELISLQKCSTVFHHDNLQSVRSNGHVNVPPVGNGLSSPALYSLGEAEGQQKLVEKVSSKAFDEPAKELAGAVSVVVESYQKLNGIDDNKTVEEDEADYEEETSIKKKLWNFLVT